MAPCYSSLWLGTPVLGYEVLFLVCLVFSPYGRVAAKIVSVSLLSPLIFLLPAVICYSWEVMVAVCLRVGGGCGFLGVMGDGGGVKRGRGLERDMTLECNTRRIHSFGL